MPEVTFSSLKQEIAVLEARQIVSQSEIDAFKAHFSELFNHDCKKFQPLIALITLFLAIKRKALWVAVVTTHTSQTTLAHKIACFKYHFDIKQFLQWIEDQLTPDIVATLMCRQDCDGWTFGHKIATHVYNSECVMAYLTCIDRTLDNTVFCTLVRKQTNAGQKTLGHMIASCYQDNACVTRYLTLLDRKLDNQAWFTLMCLPDYHGQLLGHHIIYHHSNDTCVIDYFNMINRRLTDRQLFTLLSQQNHAGNTIGHAFAFHRRVTYCIGDSAAITRLLHLFDRKLIGKMFAALMSKLNRYGQTFGHMIANHQTSACVTLYLEMVSRKLTDNGFFALLCMQDNDGQTLGHVITRHQTSACVTLYLEMISRKLNDERFFDLLCMQDSDGQTLGHRFSGCQNSTFIMRWLEIMHCKFDAPMLFTVMKIENTKKQTIASNLCQRCCNDREDVLLAVLFDWLNISHLQPAVYGLFAPIKGKLFLCAKKNLCEADLLLFCMQNILKATYFSQLFWYQRGWKRTTIHRGVLYDMCHVLGKETTKQLMKFGTFSAAERTLTLRRLTHTHQRDGFVSSEDESVNDLLACAL